MVLAQLLQMQVLCCYLHLHTAVHSNLSIVVGMKADVVYSAVTLHSLMLDDMQITTADKATSHTAASIVLS